VVIAREHYLVLDVEATCSENNDVPRLQMEIIEIGAVILSASDLRVVDEWQSFVRPVRHPRLTRFCTELTGIRQQDVEEAAIFPEVIGRLARWSAGFAGLVFCSWGNYDRNQIQQDCAHHRVVNPFAGVESINLKTKFARMQGGRKKLGLAEALALARLSPLGAHHRGIDDARNMARLMPWILGTKCIADGG
jgi:inhibitor of KinA sporulation pathway (predicted exonuclease)